MQTFKVGEEVEIYAPSLDYIEELQKERGIFSGFCDDMLLEHGKMCVVLDKDFTSTVHASGYFLEEVDYSWDYRLLRTPGLAKELRELVLGVT